MDKKISYQVSTELIFVKDYQSEHYRALILDDLNNRAATGTQYFFSEADAIADGERIAKELTRRDDLARYGIDSSFEVFTDELGSRLYYKKSVYFVWLPLLIETVAMFLLVFCYKPFQELSEDVQLGFGMLYVLSFTVSLIFFACKSYNYGANMASYFLYDGDFYRYFIGNEQAGNVSRMHTSTGLIGSYAMVRLLVKGEQDRQEKHKRLKMVLDDDSVLQPILNNANYCWKIIGVLHIKQKKGCFKIKCLIKKGRRNRIHKKTIYIREGYNDFEQLIHCFEYLLECTVQNPSSIEEKLLH